MFPFCLAYRFADCCWWRSALIGVAVVAIAITIVALRNDAISDAIHDTATSRPCCAEQTARAVQAIDIATSEIAERFGNAAQLPADEL